MKNNIILSVVVPSYNSESYIKDCLDSIRKEARNDVEFILVDGGSNDRTMEIVEDFRHEFSHVISEPDQGQSDAFNKGFNLAKGKYITWLNSDDLIISGALNQVTKFLKSCEHSWVTANCVYIDKEGTIKRFCSAGRYENFAVKLGLLNVMGPSTFISKELFKKIGLFNIDFHYCMDAEYWWRTIHYGEKFVRVPIFFWAFRLHEDAKTASTILKNEYPPRMLEESVEIRKKYHPSKSQILRKVALWLVRINRIINLSIPKSLILAQKYKGKNISEFKEYMDE